MGTYLNKGIDFANGDQVTADKLDSLVESATFGSGAVDNSSTQLSGGAIIVKDGGITTSKIASGVTVSFSDGSAAAPSITNSGDSNTGIYFPAENTIGVSVGGVEKVRVNDLGSITSKGDLYGYYLFMPALGTDPFSNASRLEIRKDPSNPIFKFTTYSEGSGTYNNLLVGNEAATSYAFFHTNGNVGIGNSSPATKLDVSGGITVSDGVRGGLKYGTLQQPTGVTSIEYTGIPSWARRITILFFNTSTNGTSYKQFQAGTSSGYLTSGYAGTMTEFTSSGLGSSTISTGVGLASNAAADRMTGKVVFELMDGYTWVATSVFSLVNSAGGGSSTSSFLLSSSLDRIRLTTVNGTDQFDESNLKLIYEG